MFKQLLGFSLIIIGVFSIMNFISHHTAIPSGDNGAHALMGGILVFLGVIVAFVPFKLGSWSDFGD